MKKRLLLISLAFSLSFIMLIVMCFFSMNRFSAYANYSNLMDTSGFILGNVYQAESHLKDIQRSERGFLLTKDTLYERYIFSAVDSIKDDLKDLEKLVYNNEIQIKNISKLRDTLSLYTINILNNVNNIDTSNSNYIKKYLVESRELNRACARMLKIIHEHENLKLSDRLKNEHMYLSLTENTLFYLFIIFCIVTLFLFILLINEFRVRFQYQQELQTKVIDLKRSHIELEEIAYAASHDLQEPLRKIQVFCNMLLFARNEGLNEEQKETLFKISKISNRMQALIENLLSLTSLTKKDEQKSKIDLNRVIGYLIIDFEERFLETNTTIEVEKLPTLYGYENQIKILFAALIDNSLKFAKKTESPKININFHFAESKDLENLDLKIHKKRFYLIEFSDNGIGFDNKYMDKIFKMFQSVYQLPNEKETKNIGVGLAICQRIITNHGGYLYADGIPDKGATFKLYFPFDVE